MTRVRSIADRRRSERRKADAKFLLVVSAGFVLIYVIGFIQGFIFSGT